MKVITQYLKETYSEAFRDIHAINQDAATTKLIDALWAPIGDATNANTTHPDSLQGLENEVRLLQFCLQGGGGPPSALDIGRFFHTIVMTTTH